MKSALQDGLQALQCCCLNFPQVFKSLQPFAALPGMLDHAGVNVVDLQAEHILSCKHPSLHLHGVPLERERLAVLLRYESESICLETLGSSADQGHQIAKFFDGLLSLE